LDIVVSTKTKTVPILVFPVLFGKYRNKSSNSCPWTVESSVSAGGKALRSPECLVERRRISIRDVLPLKVKNLIFNTFVVCFPLPVGGDPAEQRGHLFSDWAASLAGLDWLAQLAFPLPAGGDSADASVGIFGMRGIVGLGRDWLAQLAVPLPAGGIPARAGKCRKATFLFWRAASGKPGCSPK